MKNGIIFLSFLILLTSCQKKLSKQETIAYQELGAEITKSAGKELTTQLTQKLSEGGIEHALTFCNENAIDITDRIADIYHADVQRISHKNRNSVNMASSEDLDIINRFFNDMQNNKELKPILDGNDSFVKYYAPILTQEKCLTCHGVVGITMNKETDSIIKNIYPTDLATGFQAGDLRGVWKVTFKEKIHENIN
ncbi:Tll0287-like domain-containing protein [Namhaeicola litoreus]|uniref:DUF3365 domain-containing protein n=1 Tax=Namhaeicola litoreus TaxID=1052145 RepID=A0ABW3Y0C0_9FLAO